MLALFGAGILGGVVLGGRLALQALAWEPLPPRDHGPPPSGRASPRGSQVQGEAASEPPPAALPRSPYRCDGRPGCPDMPSRYVSAPGGQSKRLCGACADALHPDGTSNVQPGGPA